MTSKEEEKFIRDFQDITNRSADKLDLSTAFMTTLDPLGKNPLQLIQIGLAVCMDKPIYFLIKKGMKVPRHLARIASGWEVVESETQAGYEKAVTKLIEKIYKDFPDG